MAKDKWTVDKNDLIHYPLLIYRYVGHHPTTRNWIRRFFSYITIFLGLSFISLAIKGIAVTYNNNLFFMSECIQTCIMMTHVITKCSAIHFRKEMMIELLEMKTKFWKIEDFDGDIYEECKSISKICKFTVRFYFNVVYVSAISFYIQPFTAHELPAIMYVPEGWFVPLTILIFYMCPFIIGTIVTDGFYCAMCISLFIQFKLLSHRFKSIKLNSSNNIKEELKELIKYHNFLLKYYEKLNQFFSPVFLTQFLISVASISVSVFILTQENIVSLIIRIKCLFYAIIITIESSFYCFPSQFTAEAAHKVGIAVYKSKWYQKDVMNIRKYLLVVMAKAQDEIVFHGYGMVWINVRTFVLLGKTTFSFYTYLTNIKKG